jgi:uncharacterized membrane protein
MEKNLIYFTVLVSAMVVDVLVYDLFFPTDAKTKNYVNLTEIVFFGLIIALIAISFCHFILIEKDHIHFYIDDVKMPLSKEQAFTVFVLCGNYLRIYCNDIVPDAYKP